MLKLLHTKLDKPKLLTTFPNNSTGSDGDIVISTISGKGTYICVKSNGRWYAANKMEDLSNIGKSSFNKLLLKKLTVKEVENAGSDTDKFLVLDSGNQLKFRTGSETLSDIGALGSLTFGIADTNAVKIDSSSVADDEYARFTASGLESRSTAEVLSDIGAQASLAFGISDTNVTKCGAGIVDDDFIRVNGTTFEGRSASEVRSDIGAGTSSVGALNDLSDVTYSSGDLTISSLDKIIGSSLELETDTSDITMDSFRDFVVDAGRYAILDSASAVWYFKKAGTTLANMTESSFNLKEQADANADAAGFGQLWVHDTSPNELCFTDDGGTDIIGVGKYHYETKFIGFYAGQTAQYIPMTGYIIEKTSTGSSNEFISFVTPYNCTIEKFIYRSEVAQNGTFSLRVLESSDNTEVPSSVIYRKDTTIDIADDTFLDYDLTSPSTGSDYAPLTKGKIYAIYVATPAVGYDSNITVVFKWDITS